MSQRDGMRVERALAILGSAFLLGGLLGAALVSMIAQPAAEALTAYLRDYLTAGQAGKVAVDFWPMLWEQGRFFVGVCVLGLTALGAAGIPVLFGARGFLFAFSVAGFCRAFGLHLCAAGRLLRRAFALPAAAHLLYHILRPYARGRRAAASFWVAFTSFPRILCKLFRLLSNFIHILPVIS